MFRIKYNYTTGNSFGSEEREDYLELEFNDVKVAEANLDRINEHWEQYKDLDRYSHKNREEILENNKDKDWFVKQEKLAAYKDDIKKYQVIHEKDRERYIKAGYNLTYVIDYDFTQNTIILYTDDGKPFQFWPSWCGYFERLNSIEIITNYKKYEY
jgi:hypothetical protein